ncbi:hypothetical protein P167DRAFT_610103 [Morchella conica CCBAS932]|uniref:Uncharacterized protein n=1 Tax=Morchella conica CCBAS932 TaxID=1392247 RepID=A0A3N4K797_9PEZI|nr:hypothetical protein P167DRAFT_610103 [Morchella conica CCBAS932]
MSLPSFSSFISGCAADAGRATPPVHDAIPSVPEADMQPSRMLGPNPSAHETQELVWSVYRAKPWDSSYREVTKAWKAIALDLQDRGMFMEKDGHYVRRRTLALLDIHHNPKKDYKFFVTEEQRVSLEGALERIPNDWEKSEERKKTRTEGKERQKRYKIRKENF